MTGRHLLLVYALAVLGTAVLCTGAQQQQQQQQRAADAPSDGDVGAGLLELLSDSLRAAVRPGAGELGGSVSRLSRLHARAAQLSARHETSADSIRSSVQTIDTGLCSLTGALQSTQQTVVAALEDSNSQLGSVLTQLDSVSSQLDARHAANTCSANDTQAQLDRLDEARVQRHQSVQARSASIRAGVESARTAVQWQQEAVGSGVTALQEDVLTAATALPARTTTITWRLTDITSRLTELARRLDDMKQITCPDGYTPCGGMCYRLRGDTYCSRLAEPMSQAHITCLLDLTSDTGLPVHTDYMNWNGVTFTSGYDGSAAPAELVDSERGPGGDKEYGVYAEGNVIIDRKSGALVRSGWLRDSGGWAEVCEKSPSSE